jgi:hypothetical protein
VKVKLCKPGGLIQPKLHFKGKRLHSTGVEKSWRFEMLKKTNHNTMGGVKINKRLPTSLYTTSTSYPIYYTLVLCDFDISSWLIYRVWQNYCVCSCIKLQLFQPLKLVATIRYDFVVSYVHNPNVGMCYFRFVVH